MGKIPLIKLEIYIPETHVEKVKDAIFAAGAGKIGNYDRCCWQASGVGQFRACEGSSPFIGKQDEVEKVAEIKIETVCDKGNIAAVVKALKKSHPYETPAYQYWEVNK